MEVQSYKWIEMCSLNTGNGRGEDVEEKRKTLRQLIDVGGDIEFVKGRPVWNVPAKQKEYEIAKSFAKTLADENLTAEEAISVLEKSKEIIMKSQFLI